MMKITAAQTDFIREPLLAPFGFKGAYLNELWQTQVSLSGSGSKSASGSGTQSILWSDPSVFVSNSEAASNSMMFLSTAEAAKASVGLEWNAPVALQEAIFEMAHRRASEITGRGSALRPTFTLNSMVALDNAAWLLMAREQGLSSFDTMIPSDFRPALSSRNSRLAMIPLVSYGVSQKALEGLLQDGCCLLKIKIGSDPEHDGDLSKMLEWDKARLAEIHNVASKYSSPHTESGSILYYLDANGRYDSAERVASLLDHACKIGALDRIILLEEPFPEDMKIDVSSLPVTVVADESAHSVEDVEERIALGYKAVALKPIAKTLSMSLKMLLAAQSAGMHCFCADLTVTPSLVQWNKNVAARLKPLPGMKIGALESNGAQNYRNWDSMLNSHPASKASWMKPQSGAFVLEDGFYSTGGGIFDEA